MNNPLSLYHDGGEGLLSFELFVHVKLYLSQASLTKTGGYFPEELLSANTKTQVLRLYCIDEISFIIFVSTPFSLSTNSQNHKYHDRK